MRELLLLLLVAPISHASARVNPRQAEVMGYPIYHNGPYPFIACTESQGQALIDLFQKTGQILSNQVIPALSKYPQDPAQDAFTTFFSTNSRANVQEVFQKIVDRPRYLKYGVEQYAPHIVCLNNDHTPPQLENQMDECNSFNRPLAFTHGPNPIEGTDVFLCPNFFTDLKAFPEPAVNCPTMVYRLSSKEFQRHSDAVDNQFGVLIHELAHVYHPDQAWADREIYDLNALINAHPRFDMTADHQLNNANNYAYFAVCVYIGCRNYPLYSKKVGKNKRQSSADFNTTDPIPDVLEDVTLASYSFDANQLQANLTALGY